jgi:catechol 2,3-dioxygenase-like lactoylglutathione lyase family enzyme
MRNTGHYPVLLVDNVDRTARFYEAILGFARSFSADWYVHLRSSEDEATELAIMRFDHDTIPLAGRRPTGGLLLNFEVDDVDAVHDIVMARGAEPVQPLRSEPFGQRHFILADPDGVLIDIITPIPFDPEWLAAQTA